MRSTAAELDQRGEHVTVIDLDQRAFNRLPQTFGGRHRARQRDGDEDILRGAGAEMADLLMALTEGDNRNALAAQLGKHIFGIPRVIAKINDPLRAEAYPVARPRDDLPHRDPRRRAGHAPRTTAPRRPDGQVEPPTAEPMRGARRRPPAGSDDHDHCAATRGAGDTHRGASEHRGANRAGERLTCTSS